jgi:serine/threonine protein kinase
MSMYELFSDEELDSADDVGFLARILLAEAFILQHLAAHPHPHLAKYHGVRARRGRITGLVLDRYPRTLLDHVRQGRDLNRDEFVSALESAVAHLHSLGLAHNDINPENIMMGEDNLPVLLDFGSCQPFGKRMLTQSTEGWVETVDLYSKQEHDVFALGKLQEWFDDPWFD